MNTINKYESLSSSSEDPNEMDLEKAVKIESDLLITKNKFLMPPIALLATIKSHAKFVQAFKSTLNRETEYKPKKINY